MKRKLIAFDIDGTLVNSEAKVLDSTLEVVDTLKQAGHFVTLATGRSLPTTKEVISQLDFSNYILCNGAYAFVNHEQIFSNPLDKGELTKLVAMANEYQIDLFYQTMHEVKQQGPFIHEKNRVMQENFATNIISYDFDIAKEAAIYQAVIFCDREEGKLFEHQFEQIRFTRWGEVAMDATPVNGSKAHTLDKIARENNFSPADVVVFGDGENDIEMLRYAGLGVVMDNASDIVKVHGDYITKSNDEDGIWHAAKAHGLI